MNLRALAVRAAGLTTAGAAVVAMFAVDARGGPTISLGGHSIAVVPIGGDGQPCTRSGGCNGGLSCYGFSAGGATAGVCHHGGAQGETCRPNGSCDSGLTCQLGSCQLPPPDPHGTELAPCRDAGDPAGRCDAGLACTQLGICMVPAPQGGLGQGCRASNGCDAGLQCNAQHICGVAAQAPPQGGDFQACKPGAACDNAMSLCVGMVCMPGVARLVHKGAFAQTCRDGARCDSGLQCLKGACIAPSTGRRPRGGTWQACGPHGSCQSGDACVAGACVPSLSVAQRSAAGTTAQAFSANPTTIKTGGDGQLCRLDGSCDHGLVCEIGRCVAHVGNAGDKCRVSHTCNSNALECVGGKCVAAGGKDEPCRSPWNGSPCNDAHLSCYGQTPFQPGACRHVGAHGEACKNDGNCDTPNVCDSSACALLSLNTCTKCKAPGEEHAPCKPDRTCNSGLSCSDTDVCTLSTKVGGSGQQCLYNSTCDDDANYDCEGDGACWRSGSEGHNCRLGAPQCDDGLTCGEHSKCKPRPSNNGNTSGSVDAGGGDDDPCACPQQTTYCVSCPSLAYAPAYTIPACTESCAQSTVPDCTVSSDAELTCDVVVECTDGSGNTTSGTKNVPACSEDGAKGEALKGEDASRCTTTSVECCPHSNPLCH